MTKAWKPLSEKRGFNRLAKELKRERKNAQPAKPAPKKEEKKMNERIKELANIWANRRAEDEKLGIVYTFSEPALEQFAQLIVQECIGAISEVKEVFFKFRLETDDFTEKNKFWAGEDACNQSVRKIETHFGVEE